MDFIIPFLSEHEVRLWRMIEHAPAPARHPARNCLFNIARAVQILPIDPDMAVFRCLNAEEEAARAVFHALQRRGYPGSDRLKWRNHHHKAAVLPFIMALAAFHAKQSFVRIRLETAVVNGRECFQTVFDMALPTGEPISVRPKSPLGLRVRLEGVEHDFGPEILELANAQRTRDIQEFIRSRANLRNQILYATQQGFATLAGDTGQLVEDLRMNARSLLVVYLLIDECAELQEFVVQVLPAFLRVLDNLRPGRLSVTA